MLGVFLFYIRYNDLLYSSYKIYIFSAFSVNMIVLVV